MEDDFDNHDEDFYINGAMNDELDEDFDENDVDGSKKVSDYDVESAGFMDGESDANLGMPKFGSYGSSLDLDDLTDEQRDLYDNAYYSGNDAASDFEEDPLDEY